MQLWYDNLDMCGIRPKCTHGTSSSMCIHKIQAGTMHVVVPEPWVYILVIPHVNTVAMHVRVSDDYAL